MVSFLWILFVLGSYIYIMNAARPDCKKPIPGGETVTVLENATLNHIVFTYEGYDRDNDKVVFTPRETISPFFFDGKDINEEYFKLNDTLDFETKNQYNFTNIYATHMARKIGTECPRLTVNVLPVNEFTPIFHPSLLVVHVPEGHLQGFNIAVLNCTDEDKEPIGSPEGCSKMFVQSGDDVNPRFTIINETVITTNNAIDYDTGDVTFTLIIVGNDSSTLDPQKTGTMTITINIDPVNEFWPDFKDLPLSLSVENTSLKTLPTFSKIPETMPVGVEFFRVNVTDDDAEPHGDLTYKITDGDPNGTFLISQTTGKMYLRRPLDFESSSGTVYHVTVEASDGEFNSSAVVTITITDVNDNVPECTPTFVNETIDEDMPIGSKVTTINCTDNDQGTILTYHIQSGDRGFFQTSVSGDITVANELPYDEGISTFFMEVEISDGLHNSTVRVLVLLNPVNEFPPKFSNAVTTVSEFQDVGYEIMSYVAVDGDAPPHGVTSYEKIAVHFGDRDTFHVDEKTGKIFLTSKLDPEKTSQYEILIKVTDGGSLFATGTVTVNVKNENNNAPVCLKTAEVLSIPKSTGTGRVILTGFKCMDRDGDVLTFNLATNPDDGSFQIDSVKEELKVTGPLDYWKTPFYSMSIIVSDGQFSTEINLGVNILNGNDHDPQYRDKEVSSIVSEGDKPGTYVATVSASDEDKDSLTYSFVGKYLHFMIDPKVGIIKLRTMVDREKTDSFIILVRAFDGKWTSTATVSVSIDDINEKPVFKTNLYEFYIDESDLPGDVIGQLSADDFDAQTQNREIRYSIRSGSGQSSFKINGFNGLVTLDVAVDYERQKTEMFIAEASDSGSPPLSSSCTVIVHIRDNNDNTPEFLSPLMYETISEGTPFGVLLTRVVAIDKDSTFNDNNRIFYQSASSVPFTIDKFTGDLIVTGNLDRESNSRYNMIITARDNGSPPLTGTMTLQIEITDINDNDPVVIRPYIKTVHENVPVNFEVFRIIASDADKDANGKLKYEILSSGMNSIFTIEESTGSLRIESPLDRETCDKYEIVIKVSDSGTPTRSTMVTAIVYVSDVNDMAPKTTKPSYDFSVSENIVIGTTIGVISVTDQDSGINSQVTFTIAMNWKGAPLHFEVERTTGTIYTTANLDRELDNDFSFFVRAKDGGTPSLWSDISVNIKIEDVNDNKPMFRHTEYSASIFENITTGTNFLSTGATDDDLGDNALIRYDLDISTENGQKANYYFGVHRSTGNIFLLRNIDRDVYPSFTLTVIARDNGIPSLWNQAKIQINIEDVNDNVPVFSPLFYNAEVSSVNLCDAVVTTVKASDPDLGPNAVISYSFQENDASGLFSISFLGEVTAKSYLVQSKYVTSVTARDNGNPALTSKQNAKIRIDRFDPDRVIITFHLNMLMTSYLSIESLLLNHIEESLSLQYPNVYVRRWCIEESMSLLVHIYAVKNDETNDHKNIHIDKIFLTNGEFISNLKLDQNERPTVDVNGKDWNHYDIIKVTHYGNDLTYPDPSVSALSDSTDDLALSLGVSLPIILLVVLTTIIVLYIVCRRRSSNKKEKKTVAETKSRTDTIDKAEEERIPDSKETINNKPVTTETKLNSDIYEHWQHSLEEAPGTRIVSGPYIRQPPMMINDRSMAAESSPVSTRVSYSRGAISPANARKQDLNTKRHGMDIVTGWMYEEDPETKARIWIK